jgi:Chloroplast import apparatus Tic20-like
LNLELFGGYGMTWRGTTTVPDRIYASLPYLIPLVEVLFFAGPLVNNFPVLGVVLSPLIILASIYQNILPFGLGSLVIFIVLFSFVIRNERISHFIRFNAMQAILLDIVMFLVRLVFGLVLKLLVAIPNGTFALETLSSTIFLGIVAAVGYSVVQCIRGKYAEIPAISDAVYMQVR